MADELPLEAVLEMGWFDCYNTLLLTEVQMIVHRDKHGIEQPPPTGKTFGEILREKLQPHVDHLHTTMEKMDFDLEGAVDYNIGMMKGMKNGEIAIIMLKAAAHLIQDKQPVNQALAKEES